MLKALVDLGSRLEVDGKLPPVGFYSYGQPIKWTVHFWSQPDKVDINENDELLLARPYSGRTSGIQAHPVADEAAYALGVSSIDEEKTDKRAEQKHAAFMPLLREAAAQVRDPDVRDALRWLIAALEHGAIQEHPRMSEMAAKDWVSFMPEDGVLAGRHLFDHPEIRAFWVQKAQSLVAQRSAADTVVHGECSICGTSQPLIRMIPLNAKLNKTTPIHSLNANAFVSFITTTRGAHIGLCYECADTATRAFNYLSSDNSANHRKSLIRDKQSGDSLKNQIALFWTHAPGDLQIGDASFTLESMSLAFSQTILEDRQQEDIEAPVADVAQLQELMKLPWKPRSASLNLDDYKFYLAVLSPNVGRIAVREWIDVSLRQFKEHLTRYLDALSISYPFGGRVSPISISTLFNALTPKKSKSAASNPAVVRAMLRCAYLGHAPPQGILNMAVQRFRVPATHEEPWRLHALAAAMKLVATHHDPEEAIRMRELDTKSQSSAYVCGQLLAIIEKAQEMAQERGVDRGAEDDKGQGSRTMLVDRFYGGASTTPGSSFPTLVKLLNTAYLPQLRKNDRYYHWVRGLMERGMVQLEAVGGFPTTLSLPEQAEFALGFYCQRAAFRKPRDADREDSTREEVPA